MNRTKIAEVLKIILIFYVIANLIFAAVMYFFNDMTFVKEMLLRTSCSVGIAVLILLAIAVLESIEARKWDQKSKDIFYGNTDYHLLRCSSGYFQLPIITVLIDLMVGIMLWREFGKDIDGYLNILQEETMASPMFCLVFFNCAAIFTALYYCSYKVCYTRYGLYVVHFLKKTGISYGELKKISYCAGKKDKKKRLLLETAQKRVVLRSDVLTDGWDEFVCYLMDVAEERNIVTETVFMKPGL